MSVYSTNSPTSIDKIPAVICLLIRNPISLQYSTMKRNFFYKPSEFLLHFVKVPLIISKVVRFLKYLFTSVLVIQNTSRHIIDVKDIRVLYCRHHNNSSGSVTPCATPESAMSVGSDISDLSRTSPVSSSFSFRMPERLQIVKPIEGELLLSLLPYLTEALSLM